MTILLEDTYGMLHASLADGSPLLQSTVDRLACSARHIRIVIGADGRETNLGTTNRVPSRAQRRALEARDGGCRIPGCSRPQWMAHAHHMQHVDDGEETSLDNLVVLCEYHHGLMHEGRYGLRRLHTGQLEYSRPNGSLIAILPYAAFDDELPLTG